MIISDKTLSQKIERAESVANADFVESRARLLPASGAAWIEVGGAYAMFDGVESPCTQTFGLGLFEAATNEHLAEIEEFFSERGAPVFHEVSPMADPSLISLLNVRGYQPIEFSNVMYSSFNEGDFDLPSPHRDSEVLTRIISEDEIESFARTSVAGWSSEMPEFASHGMELCRVSASSKSAFCFVGELGGNPIATATLIICGEVAILAGASTIPEGRSKGAQNALLRHRLKFAVDQGCTLATMGALPGSQSQKNGQKNGFDIAYTRTKWQLSKA